MEREGRGRRRESSFCCSRRYRERRKEGGEKERRAGGVVGGSPFLPPSAPKAMDAAFQIDTQRKNKREGELGADRKRKRGGPER